MPAAPDPNRPGFHPVIPSLIGIAVALGWLAVFPVLARLCAWADALIARVAP